MEYATVPPARCIILDERDNVAILPDGGVGGTYAACLPGRLAGDIPRGHKVAVRDIGAGEAIVKYGRRIGQATRPIVPGEWIHTHNAESALRAEWDMTWSRTDETAEVRTQPPPSFMGFPRNEGVPGIRNDLWIIPTVGCVNDYLRFLVKDYVRDPWITDVRVLAHPYGCSQLGEDLERTIAILAGLARNPCAAGVVIAGLGCENLRRIFLETRLHDVKKVRFLFLQEVEDDRSVMLSLLDELADAAPRERLPFPLSDVVIGVKCGGSDGFSGLSANPLSGRVSDAVCTWGGRVLATEIPEMFGAESVVASRIAERSVFDAFVGTVRWFRDYYASHGQPVYENPSPGNRDGGITTLEEKSLGAVMKFGSSPVTDVLSMGIHGTKSGVNIVFGPGNDLVSSTVIAAGGAQIVLFTTGRGTPFSTVVPTIKISSNTALSKRKPLWIDFDAGPLLEGENPPAMARSLIGLLAETASGRLTKSERNACAEIAIFKDGVTL
jgi:altronate hydrolase